ncbi:MAG: D-alanine--D-alanine ligase family protein, partial [Clostridium sp.]|nr:D-alanine--D-alanine ligase family protein [Clostridium sp.]
IDLSKYDPYPIGITKGGKWFEYTGSIDKIENGDWEKDEFYKAPNGQEILFNKEVDVVFPVMHGLYGEDGTIQGLCKLVGLPCVGPGVMASAVCMDKVYTKYLLEDFGIKQADYVVVNAHEYDKEKERLLQTIEGKLGYDVFIKPSNSGSSVGISKAHNRNELEVGLEKALVHDRKILVEKAINAREVEVAVLGNDEPIAATPGEIIPANEFYDYEAKYSNAESKLLIPANLSEDKLEFVRQEAVKIYKILDCAGMSRVDFLVDKDTEEVYLNEINTIPGFTKISMYPKMWQADGKAYRDLISELIELAVERNNR